MSAITTAYNSAATIQRAVESVLRQTMGDLELIVVDDASSDDTVARVEGIDDARIRIIRNQSNRGIGGAKNVGVEAARGNTIAFIDSDDTWEPEKLAVQIDRVAGAKARAPLSFTAFWVHRVDSGKTVLRCPQRQGTWLNAILLGETFSLGSTLLATKSCFDAIGPFEERLRRLQDRDWTLRYLRRWDEFDFVDRPLAHIYNTGFPKAETVEAAVDALFHAHEDFLTALDPSLARTFRTSLTFEVAVSEYRMGQVGAAGRRLSRAVVRNPSFASYLLRRARRKVLQRDLA